MIYLYYYLGIGIAVLAVVHVVYRLAADRELSDALRKISEAMDARQKKPERLFLLHLVDLGLVAVLNVLLWPLVADQKCRDILSSRIKYEPPVERVFAVEREHLLERLSIAQIEIREVVTDPLAAVPKLPFGHLNAAWKAFAESVGAGDEIWSFTMPWETTWGSKELRSGYVAVADGAPGTFFLTLQKSLDDE